MTRIVYFTIPIVLGISACVAVDLGAIATGAALAIASVMSPLLIAFAEGP